MMFIKNYILQVGMKWFESKYTLVNQMRFLQIFLMSLLCFCMLGCGKNSSFASIGITDDFEWSKLSDTKLRIFIKYSTDIKGYDVTALCLVDTVYNKDILYGKTNAIYGKAFIHFKKDNKEFIIINNSFADPTLIRNEKPIKDGEVIELDYTPYVADSLILNDVETPFFFWDVDLDGNEELVSAVFDGMSYHGHNSYDIYKIPTYDIYNIPTYGCSQYKQCDIISALKNKPFSEFDDYTEIDTLNKTIIIPFGVGVRFAGIKKYRLLFHKIYDEAIDSFISESEWALDEVEKYDWSNTYNSDSLFPEPDIVRYKCFNGEFRLM